MCPQHVWLACAAGARVTSRDDDADQVPRLRGVQALVHGSLVVARTRCLLLPRQAPGRTTHRQAREGRPSRLNSTTRARPDPRADFFARPGPQTLDFAHPARPIASPLPDTRSLHWIFVAFTRMCWWRGTVVERRSLAGQLSLSCA